MFSGVIIMYLIRFWKLSPSLLHSWGWGTRREGERETDRRGGADAWYHVALRFKVQKDQVNFEKRECQPLLCVLV